jgi:hypothetical protein
MNAVPNSIVLMFILGWQGGTINQVAEVLHVKPGDIQNADYARMEELMRDAQEIMSHKGKVPFPGLWYHEEDGTIRAATSRDI